MCLESDISLHLELDVTKLAPATELVKHSVGEHRLAVVAKENGGGVLGVLKHRGGNAVHGRGKGWH